MLIFISGICSCAATSELLAESKVVLVFNGLDTVAQVFVNDELVGSSDNMFVRYIFDIKDKLKVLQASGIISFMNEWCEDEFRRWVSTLWQCNFSRQWTTQRKRTICKLPTIRYFLAASPTITMENVMLITFEKCRLLLLGIGVTE